MKKLTVVVFAMCLALPVFVLAQENPVDKGAMMIGGSAGFNMAGGDLNKDMDGKKVTTYWVNPFALYFIMPGFGVGADVGYTKTSQGDYSLSSLGIGPTVAYFLGTGNILPFVSASYLYGSTTVKHSPEYKYTNGDILFKAGIFKMLNSKVALTFAGFYQLQSQKDKDADKAVKGNVIGVDIGLSVFK
jgi:hypothetical protein